MSKVVYQFGSDFIDMNQVVRVSNLTPQWTNTGNDPSRGWYFSVISAGGTYCHLEAPTWNGTSKLRDQVLEAWTTPSERFNWRLLQEEDEPCPF
jgi:hypothetical protein